MKCPECRAAIAYGAHRCLACGLLFEDWIESKWKKASIHRHRRPKPRALPHPRIAAAAAAALLALLAAARLALPRAAPAEGFLDAQGSRHAWGREGRPALAAVWAAADAPSERLMRVLSVLRTHYRSEELDIVAFSAAAAGAAELKEAARRQDWGVSLAARPDAPALRELFSTRAPGRALFLVDRRGAVTALDLDGSLSAEELQAEVELALWRAFPDLRSPVRSRGL